MLLQNVSGILKLIILSIIYKEDTLHQASQHMHPASGSVMPNHLNEMNEENQATDGIGDLAFDHGLSE